MQAYSDMIAERRKNVTSGVEDTYGMKTDQWSKGTKRLRLKGARARSSTYKLFGLWKQSTKAFVCENMAIDHKGNLMNGQNNCLEMSHWGSSLRCFHYYLSCLGTLSTLFDWAIIISESTRRLPRKIEKVLEIYLKLRRCYLTLITALYHWCSISCILSQFYSLRDLIILRSIRYI